MANLNDLYLKFNDKITLTSSKSKSLRTSRDALRADIKKWFSDKEKQQPKFCWQGSFAMKTVVNQIDGNEYDMDDGVYLQGCDDVDQDDWPTPSTVHKWVKDAVEDRTKLSPIDKDTCIRVCYSAGYHIDLPIYIVKDDVAYLATKKEGWIESDPKAFKDWFVDKVQDDTSYGEQLRRLVKALKAWKDCKNVDLKGIELTILATNSFDKYDNREDKSFLNTVKDIISKLETDFKCIKPVVPGENLFDSVSETKKNKIMDALSDLKDNMENALSESDEEKASMHLRSSFGDRFPKGVASTSNYVKSDAPGVLKHDGRSA